MHCLEENMWIPILGLKSSGMSHQRSDNDIICNITTCEKCEINLCRRFKEEGSVHFSLCVRRLFMEKKISEKKQLFNCMTSQLAALRWCDVKLYKKMTQIIPRVVDVEQDERGEETDSKEGGKRNSPVKAFTAVGVVCALGTVCVWFENVWDQWFPSRGKSKKSEIYLFIRKTLERWSKTEYYIVNKEEIGERFQDWIIYR